MAGELTGQRVAFVVANDSKSLNPSTAVISLQSFSSKADRLKSLGEKLQKETDPARRRADAEWT